MPAVFYLVVSLVTAALVHGILHQDSSTIALTGWDYIIVGGGTAGSVLASRLSEVPRLNVLLIEDGPDTLGVTNIAVPFLAATNFPNTPYDWNFTTTVQPGLNNRAIPFPRGHGLGGSSAINLIIYTRCSADDFDATARQVGDHGFSWANMFPYFLKNEQLVPPSGNQDVSGQFDPRLHSTTGTKFVSLPGVPQSIDHMVMETTRQLRRDFPFNLDTNSGNPLGLGWMQMTVGNGERSSARRTYLRQAVMSRRNLHVLVGSRVTRVLQVKDGAFRRVETIDSRTGNRRVYTTSRDVILSAGSIGSPSILLHSGIGDRGALSAVGIRSTLHLPSVGQNLTDHVFTRVSWFVNSTETWEKVTNNRTAVELAMREWHQSRTGFMSTGGSNHIIFSKMKDEELEEVGGTVTIDSPNPLAPPAIDPRFLSTSFDMAAMRSVIRRSFKFVSAPAWDGHLISPLNFPAAIQQAPSAEVDALLDQFIRNSSGNIHHPVSTCMMSSRNASFGVVNPDFRVKGARGLRVVDASIFPIIPSGHTQAPVYAMAERAADIIRGEL